jgi:hypothetical protein
MSGNLDTFDKAGMIIQKSNEKYIKLVSFDEDNELEIEIMGEPIWLSLHEANQIKNFLSREIEKQSGILYSNAN